MEITIQPSQLRCYGGGGWRRRLAEAAGVGDWRRRLAERLTKT